MRAHCFSPEARLPEKETWPWGTPDAWWLLPRWLPTYSGGFEEALRPSGEVGGWAAVDVRAGATGSAAGQGVPIRDRRDADPMFCWFSRANTCTARPASWHRRRQALRAHSQSDACGHAPQSVPDTDHSKQPCPGHEPSSRRHRRMHPRAHVSCGQQG